MNTKTKSILFSLFLICFCLKSFADDPESHQDQRTKNYLNTHKDELRETSQDESISRKPTFWFNKKTKEPQIAWNTKTREELKSQYEFEDEQ